MKRLIERAKGKALDIERMLDDQMNHWVRTTTRRPEPLELRNAILREIEDQVIPGPRGSQVFPYDKVTIELLAGAGTRQAALEAMFENDGGIQAAVRERLTERDCTLPAASTFQIRTITQKPHDWPSDASYRLRFRRVDQRDKHRPHEAVPILMLTLSSGARNQTYRLGEERVDIGRVAEVRDREGRFLRRNAICISDAHDPKGTVSRRHAHIKASRDAAGRIVHMLYDDGSSYGTRIVRSGETIVVHPGTLGVKLRDRDQVHFGDATAVVRIAAGDHTR
jgi:hypothetical protein